MNKYMISFDASTTCTGYAIFLGDKLVDYGKITPPKSLEWRDRINCTASEIKDILEKYKSKKAYCEDVPLKRGGGLMTLVQLGAVQGMILSLCGAYGIEIEFIPVATWRRKMQLFDGTEAGKERNNLKKASIELANKLYGLKLVYKSPSSKFNDDDVSDSILVGASTFKEDTKGFGRKSKIE